MDEKEQEVKRRKLTHHEVSVEIETLLGERVSSAIPFATSPLPTALFPEQTLRPALDRGKPDGVAAAAAAGGDVGDAAGAAGDTAFAHATLLLDTADAVLICTGAGMSALPNGQAVPDYRTTVGWATQFPSLFRKGLTYKVIIQAHPAHLHAFVPLH
jgi:hypothetical protein